MCVVEIVVLSRLWHSVVLQTAIIVLFWGNKVGPVLLPSLLGYDLGAQGGCHRGRKNLKVYRPAWFGFSCQRASQV